MQSEIYDKIAALAEDIKGKLPDSFKDKYYKKMSYSGESRIDSLEEEIINNTISFEIAFSHIIIYLFNIQFCVNSNYVILLKNLEVDEIFSWYQMDKEFIKSTLSDLHLNGFSEAYTLINQHDTFIGKDVKKKLGQFYTPLIIVKRMILDLKPNLKMLKSNDLIIDPACGTGVFLIEIIEQLKNIFTAEEILRYRKIKSMVRETRLSIWDSIFLSMFGQAVFLSYI